MGGFIGWLLSVERSRNAQSALDRAQSRRNSRASTQSSKPAPIPRSGFVLRPNAAGRDCALAGRSDGRHSLSEAAVRGLGDRRKQWLLTRPGIADSRSSIMFDILNNTAVEIAETSVSSYPSSFN